MCHPKKELSINVFTLTVRKERPREVKQLAQGYSASVAQAEIGTLDTCTSGISSGLAPAASSRCNSSEDPSSFSCHKTPGSSG